MTALMAQEVAPQDQLPVAAPFWMNPLFLLAVPLIISLVTTGLVLWLVRMQSRENKVRVRGVAGSAFRVKD